MKGLLSKHCFVTAEFKIFISPADRGVWTHPHFYTDLRPWRQVCCCAWRPGDIDQLLHGWRLAADASSVALSAARRKLYTDLLFIAVVFVQLQQACMLCLLQVSVYMRSKQG